MTRLLTSGEIADRLRNLKVANDNAPLPPADEAAASRFAGQLSRAFHGGRHGNA